MKPVLFSLFGTGALGATLATLLDAESGNLEVRRFPDGESYVRFDTVLDGRDVILLCSLDQPDGKFLPLVFSAATARELGARNVGLICPYLAYMRQDKQFRAGEGITSCYFAKALSQWFDWLVTVDPHLHRRTSIEEIYSIPCAVVHAAPVLSSWIRDNIERPLIIGPDSESEQWVAAVARAAGAPHLVLEKTRRGDRDVEVSGLNVNHQDAHVPVVVDDIISTAHTMIETVKHIREAGLAPPVCIAVHGLFAGDAQAELDAAGAQRIVTCNTVPHDTNTIDITQLLVQGVRSVTERAE